MNKTRNFYIHKITLILFSLFIFLSCSKKNYKANFISNDEVIFSLKRIVINDTAILNEVKQSIENYKKDCGFKPDYVTLDVIDGMILKLTKYQDSDDEKVSLIKEELKFARGVSIIDKVPVIIYFSDEEHSLFLVINNKLTVNFKSSNTGCFIDRYYEFENGKLKLYSEYFLGDIKIRKAIDNIN